MSSLRLSVLYITVLIKDIQPFGACKRKYIIDLADFRQNNAEEKVLYLQVIT